MIHHTHKTHGTLATDYLWHRARSNRRHRQSPTERRSLCTMVRTCATLTIVHTLRMLNSSRSPFAHSATAHSRPTIALSARYLLSICCPHNQRKTKSHGSRSPALRGCRGHQEDIEKTSVRVSSSCARDQSTPKDFSGAGQVPTQ